LFTHRQHRVAAWYKDLAKKSLATNKKYQMYPIQIDGKDVVDPTELIVGANVSLLLSGPYVLSGELIMENDLLWVVTRAGKHLVIAGDVDSRHAFYADVSTRGSPVTKRGRRKSK